MPPVYSDVEQIIARNSFNSVLIASVILLILIGISILVKKLPESLKKVIFILICATTILTTLYLAAVTVHLNNISVSKGPVHYHADLEIWSCEQEVNLKDPIGWSNKIGTATLHEHSDKRIHLEGVVVVEEDASLGKFFNVIGGQIDTNSITIPTNNGLETFAGKDICPNGQPATLQVFAYKVVNNTAIQTKVSDPAGYIIAPQSQIPPGDCIIIEYGPVKEKTERECLSFKVAKELGKLK